MNKVLITGADGFLGQNLVSQLLKDNVYVYAIVYPGNNVYADRVCENFTVIELDMEEIPDIAGRISEEIDCIYHFAWVGVQPELRNDYEVQMRNIKIAMNCLKIATDVHAKKIVFPGSTNEYLYYGKPINKDAIPSPRDAYGATKVAIRYLCSANALNMGIDFVYVIIASIYAEDRRDNNVVFYTINCLLNKQKPSLTKLEQLWDYVYIDDVIDALVLIGERGQNGMIYAIGHGDNCPLRNYIEVIHEKINSDIPLGIGEVAYSNDVLPSSCIDLTDIKKDTGYIPKISFEEGISRVIKKIRTDMERENNE